MAKSKVLILPSDTPPDESAIKRQLLFFDSVLLLSPADNALINRAAITETFPNGRIIKWGEILPYPRSDNYVDALRTIADKTTKLQGDGKLRFLHPAPPSVVDPTQTWVLSAAASGDSELLRAAVPDHHPDRAPLYLAQGQYNLAVFSDENYESKYHWLAGIRHSELAGVELEWSRLASCRLGRALKAVNRAGIENAFPLALDRINESICLALGRKAFPDIPASSQLADISISLDVVDPRDLSIALADLSWDGVSRLRREVLPQVAKLRGLLQDAIRLAHKPSNADVSTYSSALRDLKEKHKRAAEAAGEMWRKLGFKTIDAAILSVAGLATVAAPTEWTKVLTALAISMLTKVVGGTAIDTRSYLLANRQRRATPLFFFDTLVERIKDEATKESTKQP